MEENKMTLKLLGDWMESGEERPDEWWDGLQSELAEERCEMSIGLALVIFAAGIGVGYIIGAFDNQ